MIRNTVLTGCLTVLAALILAPATYGSIYLTINGEDVNSILLTVDGWCTVEVTSDNSNPYLAYVDFSAVELVIFSHIETRSEAGEYAYVEDGDGYYEVCEVGIANPPSPGIHFVFRYDAPGLYEEFDIILKDSSQAYIDSVHVTAMGSPPATTACGLDFTLYAGTVVTAKLKVIN